MGKKIQAGDDEEEGKGYLPVKLNNITELNAQGKIIPHPIIANFKANCKNISVYIYRNNHELLKQLGITDLPVYEQTNKIASYFFQAIENHCLYLVYEYLVERHVIIARSWN